MSGEASPVSYRKARFDTEKRGSFWLSETPDVPASKCWGTCCTRVCSYLIQRDRTTGKRFCFANTHTDHVSAEAREKGMLLTGEALMLPPDVRNIANNDVPAAGKATAGGKSQTLARRAQEKSPVWARRRSTTMA